MLQWLPSLEDILSYSDTIQYMQLQAKIEETSNEIIFVEEWV